jgi:hypothetical protein
MKSEQRDNNEKYQFHLGTSICWASMSAFDITPLGLGPAPDRSKRYAA